MQNVTEHLLTHLSEEAGEIVQRIAKIARFGLEEIQEGHTETNQERLEVEVNQFLAVADILCALGVLPNLNDSGDKREKLQRVYKYAKLSVARGRLSPDALASLQPIEMKPKEQV